MRQLWLMFWFRLYARYVAWRSRTDLDIVHRVVQTHILEGQDPWSVLRGIARRRNHGRT